MDRFESIIFFAFTILIISSILLTPVSIFDEDQSNHIPEKSDIIGYAYYGYSDPVPHFKFEENFVSTYDTLVYRYGYYSINGGAWQRYTFSGDALTDVWIKENSTATLPELGEGHHYVISYSCTSVSNSWDCHGNKWQILEVNRTVANNVCVPDCAGKQCGDDGCNGTCGTCSQNEICTGSICSAIPTENLNTGNVYYISTSGNDTNDGKSISTAFASWQKGFDMAQAGDTVYILGGTYNTSGKLGAGNYNCVFAGSKSGTQENMIKVWAYPGQKPVLDCKGMTAAGYVHRGLALENSNYWHLKGLTVINVNDALRTSWGALGFHIASSNNIIENCVSRDNQGPGFAIKGDNNLFLNCDAYNNYDSTVGGENADGFILGKNTNRHTNTFRGCRSFNNSDDGYDTYAYEGIVRWENCWAFDNGYGTSGDGAGFKQGSTTLPPLGTPQKVLTNCISANNKGISFDESQDGSNYSTIHQILNSISYNSTETFNFGNPNTSSVDIFKNCISYKDRYFGRIGPNINENNSWNNGVVLSDADFVSLDSSQLWNERKSDGSLPDITFMHLKSDSDLIDKGANVGLPYLGQAPDIGAFEYR